MVHNRVFIDGVWMPASGTESIPVINPASEETIAIVAGAGETNVADACESAARALGAWSARPLAERADMVMQIATAIGAQTQRIAELVTDEVGTPIIECAPLQVGAAARIFRRAAEIGCAMDMVETMGATKVFKVPVGVVACITPWNYPLFLIASKVAAALVAGCTVVLKPSEVAPGSAVILADIMRDVGIPGGVLNVVIGSGAVVGKSLVQNPLIDAVSFTGSTQTGAQIAAVSGAGLKRVTLELGGKSPSVILPGADVATAVERTLAKCLQNAGQTCAALTRLIVPQEQCEQIAYMAAAMTSRYRIGDPRATTTRLGPVTTAAQRDHVRELMRSAAEEGACRVAGGPGQPPDMPRGFFVQPSVYIASPQMRIAQEEIFGPVLTLLPYRSEEEALQLAQSGKYGLSGAVWSNDAITAERFARKLRSGSVSINGAATHPDAPFGGFHQSGFGRERGRYGIEGFLTTQAIHCSARA